MLHVELLGLLIAVPHRRYALQGHAMQMYVNNNNHELFLTGIKLSALLLAGLILHVQTSPEWRLYNSGIQSWHIYGSVAQSQGATLTRFHYHASLSQPSEFYGRSCKHVADEEARQLQALGPRRDKYCNYTPLKRLIPDSPPLLPPPI